MPSKETTRFIAYDAFLPEIQVIWEWANAIEKHFQEEAKKQPLPIRLERMNEGRYGYNISAVVESSLMKMAIELESAPIPEETWNRYYERYVQIANEPIEAEPQAGVGQHAGEVKVWISEKSRDDILTIIRHGQRAGVAFPLYHRKDAPRFRLLVALAIMYTAEHLPPLPN